ncbi:hypothetical protein GWI33_022818 [Rhynchophorus ferrugineus]|uniref:Uncharacterized protein n=1 Tax=Rhynchophorus ferrugineus TaxID=354439 RepID=A0A834HPL0_RHYFE|nr:hypothetical protein GWI33_022818 [Rhynchophorus ferrugineus]
MEFRVLIKYCFLKGKNTVEAKIWLGAERGVMSTEDGATQWTPKTGCYHKMILNDRRLKLNEIADNLKISTERVHYITHEYMGMTKLCATWVPRKLTFDQKQRRVADSSCV